MARKSKQPVVVDPNVEEFLNEDDEDDEDEDPCSSTVQATSEPAFFTKAVETKPVDHDPDEDMTSASLSNEQRESKRLARKPTIDHLPDAIVTDASGALIPLFDVGDRIVVERYLLWYPFSWLDTKVYTVRQIDDDTGVVRCRDEEYAQQAFVGFKHAGQTFKLAPKRGNPFNVAKMKKSGVERSDLNAPAGEKKRRGRPKGSKNRPKEEIKAEREERRAMNSHKRKRRVK